MSNFHDLTADGLKNKPMKDSLAVALDAINDRWSLHVVRALAFGASRYTEILRAVGAPRDILASRLKKLTESGIVQARSTENGGGAGYELTQKGKDLGQLILVLKRWGDTYRDEDVPSVEFVHDACGQVFVAEVRCEACGRPVKPGELSIHRPEETCM
ncbi:winged helix-turn-helix transcriptional regulator [Pseudarthrobacter sp. S9]|uniref:winged helix-turn-helix transcriptional regulator n=1 Tax=Pseudarthrobacter sp. S9 TaxID=3418421 RepID=UPI003CFFA5E6